MRGHLLFVAIASVACGPLNDPADAGLNGGISLATFDDGPRRLREAFCARAMRCGTIPSGSIASCASALATTGSFAEVEAIAAGVLDGSIALDVASADACIEAVRMANCTSFEADLLVHAACTRAFSGSIPIGGTCETGFACAPGATCVRTATVVGVGGGCVGTCAPLVAGACVRPGDCPAGNVCDLGRCTPQSGAGALGQPCGPGGTCLTGLRCTRGGPTSFVCQEQAGVGFDCTLGGVDCAPGSTCVPSVDLLSAQCLPERLVGEPCSLPFECGGFGSAFVCDGFLGACVPRPASGPCFLIDGTTGVCDGFSSFCDNAFFPATCRPFRGHGATCASDFECGPSFGDLRCVTDGIGSSRCLPVRADVCGR